MRVLLWHVHGSWTTAFVQGGHEYLLPVVSGRGPDGRGRARTWEWPASVAEYEPSQLRDAQPDVVVLQRERDAELLTQWTGLRAGRDVPAVYVEHNTPGGNVPYTRHPLADQDAVPVVHVTCFNDLMWDSGRAPTYVVEHGIVDPGHRYTGDVARLGVVVNDPVRRGRAVGADLLPALAEQVPVDLFGMGADALVRRSGLQRDRLAPYDDLTQDRLHAELARRRVYVHTSRWTSLGLSLLEAMQLGMPVVALATTEAARAIPSGAGVLASSAAELVEGARWLCGDAEEARAVGVRARDEALRRYGLTRFLADWDRVLAEVAGR